jgi:hypothetical protein
MLNTSHSKYLDALTQTEVDSIRMYRGTLASKTNNKRDPYINTYDVLDIFAKSSKLRGAIVESPFRTPFRNQEIAIFPESLASDVRFFQPNNGTVNEECCYIRVSMVFTAVYFLQSHLGRRLYDVLSSGHDTLRTRMKNIATVGGDTPFALPAGRSTLGIGPFSQFMAQESASFNEHCSRTKTTDSHVSQFFAAFADSILRGFLVMLQVILNMKSLRGDARVVPATLMNYISVDDDDVSRGLDEAHTVHTLEDPIKFLRENVPLLAYYVARVSRCAPSPSSPHEHYSPTYFSTHVLFSVYIFIILLGLDK